METLNWTYITSENDTSENWDKIVNRLVGNRVREEIAIEYIKNNNNLHLDTGTGQGQFLERVRDKKINCFGIDYGFESTKICKSKGFTVVQGDGRDLPFKNVTFNSISMLDVIEHIPHPELVLKEISRVLKLGGILILTTPNTNSIQEILLRKLRAIGIISYKQPYDVPVTIDNLKKMINNNGLKIVLIRKFDYFRYYLVYSKKNIE